MKNISPLLAIIFTLSIVFSNSIYASSNTVNASNTSIISNLTQFNSETSNTLNVTTELGTFGNIVKPFSLYVDFFVIILFLIVLGYGILTIMSQEFETDITDERRLRIIIEYLIGSALVLLLIPYIYIYVTYFPEIIKAVAPQLLSIKSAIPAYIITFDLFISVLISLFGFLLAMREFIKYIKTYQTGGTGKVIEAVEAERAQILERVFAITAFMFLSPFVLGIIFILLTQMSISISMNLSSSLINISSTTSKAGIPIYQTNFYVHCPSGVITGVTHFGGWFQCLWYDISAQNYGVSFQALIFNTTANVMTSTFGDMPIFMLLYDIIALILMIYSFAKIDWYSLQYLSSLQTGEMEARSYTKLKDSYIQYLGFLFSPLLFVIAIIVLNSFTSVMLGFIMSSKLSLIPPLINLVGQPTATNLILSLSGLIMGLFGLFLLIVVIALAIIKMLGGIIFAIGVFMYLSENFKYRMFGRNLLIFFLILYITPIIIILIYSIFFGLLPTIISQALGYGNNVAVSVNLNGFQASVIPNNATGIRITGPNSVNMNVNCVNRTSVLNAEATLGSLSDSPDALGVLLGGCQNFVGYWASGYEIVAIMSLIVLIGLIIGFPSIIGTIGGITGLGSGGVSGAVPLTKGIKGKPIKSKLSIIERNIGKNRANFIKNIKKKAKRSGGFGELIAEKIGEKGKENIVKFESILKSGLKAGENLTYVSTTAPITGTMLGNAIDTFRSNTKALISNVATKTRDEIESNQNVFLSKNEIERYAKSHKRKDETDEQAIRRIKTLLTTKYGAQRDSNGNYKITRGNLYKLEKEKNIRFTVPVKRFFNEEIEDVKADRSEEINDVKIKYKPIINDLEKKLEDAKKEKDPKKRNKKIEELSKQLDDIKNKQMMEIEKINKKYKPILEEVAKKNNFKDYKTYERLREISSDVDIIANPEKYANKMIAKARERAREEIAIEAEQLGVTLSDGEIKRRVDEMVDADAIRKEAMNEANNKRSKFIEYLKEHGLKSTFNLEKMLEEHPEDFESVAYMSFDVASSSNSPDKALDMIAKAVNEQKPTIKFATKTVLGNVGREIKFQYLNPIAGTIQSKYKDVAQVIGDLKDYMFVSGVPVYQKYDDELKKYQEKINQLTNEGGKLYSIIIDPKKSENEKNVAKEKLVELNKKLNEIELEKKRLESKKDAIDHMSLVFKGVFKGETLPSFVDYVRLASSDEVTRELGRIDIQRKILENERRIIDKNINEYKTDLETAMENLNRKDLTEYQRLQFEKVVNELNYKIKNLEDTKDIYDNRISNMKDIITGIKNIKKAQDLSNNIYENSVIEAKLYDHFKKFSQQDQLVKKVKEIQDKTSILTNKYDTYMEVKDALDSLSKTIISAINNEEIYKLKPTSLKLGEEQNNKITELNNSSINEYRDVLQSSINAILSIKNRNFEEAKKIMEDKFKNTPEIFNGARDDLLNRLAQSFETIKTRYKRDKEVSDVFEKIKKTIIEKNIYDIKDIENVLNKAISESELKNIIPENSEEYKTLFNTKEFYDVYTYNISKIISDYIKRHSKETDEEVEKIVSSIKEEINKTNIPIEEMSENFGTNDIKNVIIGKYLTSSEFKNTLNQTEKIKFDYEILKNKIKNMLKLKARDLRLTDDDIEKIASFDPAVMNERNRELNVKYIKALNEVIKPSLNEIKHNKVAKIIKRVIDEIHSDEYDERLKELDSVTIIKLTSDLARSFHEFETVITGKKDKKEGMKKAKFAKFKLEVKRPGEKTNEENRSDEKLGDSEEVKLEPVSREEKSEDDDKNENDNEDKDESENENGGVED